MGQSKHCLFNVQTHNTAVSRASKANGSKVSRFHRNEISFSLWL